MPKLSLTARQRKREKMVARYSAKRALLIAEGNYEALDKLPKNSSPVRLRNRCWSCQRARGFMRLTGTCRICFRKKASNGEIPGIRKASW